MIRGSVFRKSVITLVLILGACSLTPECMGKESVKRITAEQNTTLSDLLKRLYLAKAAGASYDTGQYFVKIFEVPQGEECDAGSNLCEGVDLLVSVASPDLYGDHGLYRVKGLASWKFVEWKSYAEIDSPDHFTSFVIQIEMKSGLALSECRNARSGAVQYVTFRVNPWKISCEYGK